MQYILTQEEYNDLVPAKKYERKCHDVEKLNKLVLKLANFKCFYDGGICSYCDNCPLAEVGTCGRMKSFSK